MTTPRHRRLAKLESRVDPDPMIVELTILDGTTGAVVETNTFTLAAGIAGVFPSDFTLCLDHPKDEVPDPPADAGNRRPTR